MDYLKILLSSAVIVALIKFLQSIKDNRLQYITAERSLWRKEIKEIVREIDLADKKEILNVLIRLQCNLNSYGYYPEGQYPIDEKLDYLKDEHIWKEIDNIKHSVKIKNKSAYEMQKDRLIVSLTLLLKFEWERSKREVRSMVEIPVAFGIYIISVFLLFLSKYGIHGIQKNLVECATIGFLMIFFYILSWMPFLLSLSKYFRTPKWYKKAENILIPEGLMIINIFVLQAWSEGTDIFSKIALMLSYIGYVIVIIYPIYANEIYKDYEENLIRTLGKNKLNLYTSKKGCLRIIYYFGKYNLKAETKQFSEVLDFQELFKYLGMEDVTDIRKAWEILKRRSWIKYIWKREIQKIRTNGNILTVADYIRENPNRCRPVVQYIQDDVVRYSVGMNKEEWNKWFE